MPLMLPISLSSSAPTTDSLVDLSSEPSLSFPPDSSTGSDTSASANSPVDQPPVSTHSLVGSPSVQTLPVSSVPSTHERQPPLALCYPMITRSKDVLYSSKHSLAVIGGIV
jgi:hypothetical protein